MLNRSGINGYTTNVVRYVSVCGNSLLVPRIVGVICVTMGVGLLDDATWLDDFEDFIENRSEEMERSGRIDPYK